MSAKLPWDANGFWTSSLCNQPFNFIIMPRGTGKTYHLLEKAYTEEQKDETGQSKFIYMRRTKTELKMVTNPQFFPFKSLNNDKELGEYTKYSDDLGIATFFNSDDRINGYGIALNDMGNVRGGDYSDVTTIIWEEFIRSKYSRKLIKNEADDFFNLCETVIRNRQILGLKPLTVYLTSNATTLDSDVLRMLGLDKVIMWMRKTGRNVYNNKDRRYHVEDWRETPITHRKEDTDLYALTNGTEFYEHALHNEFAYDSMANVVGAVKLLEYKPYVRYENITIFKHKSELKLYAKIATNVLCPEYVGDKRPLFKGQYGSSLYRAMLCGYVYYENYSVKARLFGIFDSKSVI